MTGNAKFIAIIKSGLVGALAFTSISFIWVIVSMFKGPSASVIVTTFFSSQKFDFAKEVLIVIVCIGFMFGVLLRRCFPMMQKRLFLLVTMLIMLVAILAKEAFIAIFAAVLSLGFVDAMLSDNAKKFLFVSYNISHAPCAIGVCNFVVSCRTELLPVNLKLADCINNVVNVHLKIPTGHAYQLELKGSGIQFSTGREWNSSYNFSGRLLISSNGSLLANLPIGSDKSWLTGPGYVLTGAGMQNTNVPPLSKFIQSHKSYDFEISFEPPPPPGSSLWLYCTVYARDQ